MLNDKELLKLVEWVASNDAITEIPINKQTNSDKLLLFIYRAVHSYREDACCKDVHQDWRQEAEKTYKDNQVYF